MPHFVLLHGISEWIICNKGFLVNRAELSWPQKVMWRKEGKTCRVLSWKDSACFSSFIFLCFTHAAAGLCTLLLYGVIYIRKQRWIKADNVYF